jgi:hypothetical protein
MIAELERGKRMLIGEGFMQYLQVGRCRQPGGLSSLVGATWPQDQAHGDVQTRLVTRPTGPEIQRPSVRDPLPSGGCLLRRRLSLFAPVYDVNSAGSWPTLAQSLASLGA